LASPRFVLALILVACKRLNRRFSNNNQRKDDPPPRNRPRDPAKCHANTPGPGEGDK